MEKFTLRCKCNTYIDCLLSFNHKGIIYFFCERCNLYYDSEGNVVYLGMSYSDAKKIEDETKKCVQKKLSRRKYDNIINEFYYSTHISNIRSILKFGILSKNKVKFENIKFTDCSMKEVQEKRDKKCVQLSDSLDYFLHDTVPLYFTTKNPTYYRMQGEKFNDLCIIIVSRDIVDDNGLAYAFSDGNLGSKGSETYNNLLDVDKLDWKRIKMHGKWSDDDEKRKRCAEFLIAPAVHPDHFLKIVVNNFELLNQIVNILTELNIKINVEYDYDKKYFYDHKCFYYH